MPKDNNVNHILIIGSGPIIIGQACEFDYSGSQAARSLKEEGIEVSLINSNPATIMTDKVTADNIYLLPLESRSIEKILQEQKIDAVLPTMGGQTALNLCIECHEMGLGDKYGVGIRGVNIDAILVTAAAPRLPQPLVDQLAEGGRLVIPLGETFQELSVFQKEDGVLSQQDVIPVRFVPMTGLVQEPLGDE